MSDKHEKNHSHAEVEVDAKNSNLLLKSLIITAIFTIVEVIAGVISDSLTLLADAGHMFTDSLAIFSSWAAILISRKPKDKLRSFGYVRFQVLSTFINGVSLLAITVWIIYEAIRKLYAPAPADANVMIFVGGLGIIVNAIAYYIISRGSREDINIESALVHVLSDILGSLAAVLAGIIIIYTGKEIADPLLSLFVLLLLLKTTFRLIISSGHILIEGVPQEIETEAVKKAIEENIDGIDDVHHVHIWSLKPGVNLITLHVNISNKNTENDAELIEKIKKLLLEKFNIGHSTVQIDYKQYSDEEH